MPTAWLHIGAPKCASSLIQRLLNVPDSLELVGPEYQPDISKMIQAQTPIFVWEDYFIKENLNSIKAQIPKRDILFSVENVFGLMTHRDNCCEASVKVIEHLFEGFDIKLFMFIRRQDGFIESVYNQDVKRQELRDFDQYLAEMQMDNLHWDKIIETWSHFDLTVCPFEKKVLQTGGYKDFVHALYMWLGLDIEYENLPVINPSLSPGGLEVQLLANRVLPTQTAYDLSTWLEKHSPKKPDDKHDLLGNKRKKILDYYRESNRKVFEGLEFDPSYYLEE